MWAMLVLVVMVSLTGLYTLTVEKNFFQSARQEESNLAESMSTYRAGVIRYLSANPGFAGGPVSTAQLNPLLPTWYVVPQKPDLTPLWRNYVAPDRTIYVHAASPLPRSFVSAIVQLARNSVLAGVSPDGLTLYSPADFTGMPPIALPAAAGIAAGSPVWIAFAD